MKTTLKRFKEINEFFETTGFDKRTDLDDFFIFRFEELPIDKAQMMPPYQKDFYQISLIIKSKNAHALINSQSNHDLDNTLYFLSPEHIFSWRRNNETTGFVIYFKAEFLNFFNGNFETEFSYFNLIEQNFIKLQTEQSQDLTEDFMKMYSEFYTKHTYRKQILKSLLLTALYKCKSLKELEINNQSKSTKEHELFLKFKNLVSNCFIKHKQVIDYATMLHVSATSLNKIVKQITSRTPKELISEKITLEAKKLLQYGSEDVAQIAFALGFEEPTHFIRFFKKQTKLTPLEYRKTK